MEITPQSVSVWAYCYVFWYFLKNIWYVLQSIQVFFFHLCKMLDILLFSRKYYLTPIPLFNPSGTLIWKMLEFIDLFYIFLNLSLVCHLFIPLWFLLVKFCSLALQFTNFLFSVFSYTIFVLFIHSINIQLLCIECILCCVMQVMLFVPIIH